MVLYKSTFTYLLTYLLTYLTSAYVPPYIWYAFDGGAQQSATRKLNEYDSSRGRNLGSGHNYCYIAHNSMNTLTI